MDKVRIAIVFGGRSEEHPISVKSAQQVAQHLDLERYEPFWVGITRAGAWRLCGGPSAGWEESAEGSVVLSPDSTTPGLLVLEDGRCRTIGVDVVLPVLHGRLGEDGTMQGLLELSGLPYVGCDVPSSALCMDKSLTHLVVGAAGIATPRFWTVTGDEALDADGLPYPVFVKPARSGSSFGVSKVTAKQDLADALRTAREYDEKVLVEEAVVGSEIGCAVLGNGSDLTTGELDRIALTHGFFQIHQESEPESGSDNSVAVVPADIPSDHRDLVRRTAEAIYRALGCRGLARVDLFLTPDGTVVLNEVNTFPGLTSYSRYPRMMAAAGISFGDLIDRMVSLALTARQA